MTEALVAFAIALAKRRLGIPWIEAALKLMKSARGPVTPTRRRIGELLEQVASGQISREQFRAITRRESVDEIVNAPVKLSTLAKSTADHYCKAMVEILTAKREGHRAREMREDEKRCGYTFRDWHSIEHTRVLEAIDLANDMLRAKDYERAKRLVTYLETLENLYTEADILWWPTTVMNGSARGGLPELCAAARRRVDAYLFKVGAYGTQGELLPAPSDGIPI